MCFSSARMRAGDEPENGDEDEQQRERPTGTRSR